MSRPKKIRITHSSGACAVTEGAVYDVTGWSREGHPHIRDADGDYAVLYLTRWEPADDQPTTVATNRSDLRMSAEWSDGRWIYKIAAPAGIIFEGDLEDLDAVRALINKASGIYVGAMK